MSDQCQARVSHPPYYIDDFRCEHPAKYDRSGLRVCGIHARVLQRMNCHIPLGWPLPCCAKAEQVGVAGRDEPESKP